MNHVTTQSLFSLIRRDAVLISFLETGTISIGERFLNDPRYNEPALLQIIAPHFEPVFTAAVISCLQMKDTQMMRDLMANPLLLDDCHEEKSYTAILQFLNERESLLLSVRHQLQLAQPIDAVALEATADAVYIDLLNLLPDEFHSFRTEYCKEVMKTARILAKKHHKMAITMLSNILELKCDTPSHLQAERLYNELQTEMPELSRQIPAARTSIWVTIGSIYSKLF
ncbi:hypothetical protein [Chitinophaga sancti]|uniref:Uncharacterized protein n=1 Tax=Chitinophaga sancti TaxID=1004 RepID=A0A1K1M471_9BACT|nr:hypothetical protein [Chitinophaga sancti]WQD64645.1 hypothetical protein U0033_09585 [Chitinophaga sancti]WQG89732.1 hypothetical protein SR876_32890 [Chitinophaga sancti]SFW17924.1 hypothetical protein SAMN05661012_00431 [Chitinophaga sancti]